FEVTGADMSETMLAETSQKAIQQNKTISWIQQDIRALQGFKDIDICRSYCYVLNYVTEEDDIEAVCQNVFHRLKQKGLLILDINHLTYVTEHLADNQY